LGYSVALTFDFLPHWRWTVCITRPVNGSGVTMMSYLGHGRRA
jgi:hypothetical protein